jgi:hypothetical protein
MRSPFLSNIVYPRTVRLLVAVWLFACVGVAAAQPVPDSPPPEPEPPIVAPEPTPPAPPAPVIDPRTDPAWSLYHQVFAALVRGQRARARDLVSALLRDHPGHAATSLVRGSELGAGPGTVDQPPPDFTEKPTRTARAELAAFQTVHGIVAGIEVCILLECDDGSAIFGSLLLGGAAGALVSLNIGELTGGQRALLNSGTAWGAANATLVLVASQPDEGKSYALGLLAGQGAGLGIGAALSKFRPNAGQVALANSGGQWAFALTGLTLLAIESDSLDAKSVSLTLLVAMDAGIIAAAYLASRMPQVSRAQTLLIDAGGIVGGVIGGSLGILISGEASDRTTPAAAAGGVVVGLGLAAYFTRDWGTERGSSSLQTYVAPVERGRGGTVGLGFRW